MSYEDDNEKLDSELFSMRFRATRRQHRALLLKMSKSPESREWGITRNLVNLVTFPTDCMRAVALAERMENADTAMTKLTARLIEELCSDTE